MPGRFVGPFVGFEVSDFRLGGDVSALVLVGAKWRRFGEQALETAGLLRGVSDGGFVGSEGDRFRELINGEFPSHLDVAGGAHVGVGDAIAQYAHLLEGQKAQMRGLRENARVDHGVVNSTAMQLNAAEAAAAAAAGTPGAAAAIAAMEQARLAHEAAWVKWEQDLASAKAIKEVLGAGVDVQVQKIASQARKRFEENPNFLQELWQKLDDFMDKNADWLKVISDALQLIGGILALIPGLQVIGVALYAVGLGLKGLLAATGNASWEEFAFDALTSGAVGGLGKLAKLGKLGSTAQNLATKGSKLSSAAASFVKSQAKSAAKLAALRSADGMRFIANEQLAKTMYSKVTRGGQICFAAEPVDMATGNMVDFVTDVHISGVLPLVVDRHANSSHQMGRVLGPQWVSRADTHIEVMKDEILMVSPDGALLTFPLPPVDGSEVRADGRPWLLSFGDGAYRVRDISAGVVYEFRVYDLDPAEAHRSQVTTKPGAIAGAGGVVDGVPCVGGSMVGMGITPGSIADTWEIGVEIGLSALVHHTGHRIEYVWDQASGLMTAMVRSDGTRVDLGYDMVIGRLSDVWVSNPHTHPDQEPVKVIGYEYDADGQLARVRNSHDGILEYHYDSHGRAYAWTDRNGVSYFYRFDDQGRVVTQVGTGGMFPNALIWLEDTGTDAPLGGTVCVLVEAAGAFHQDPLVAGDSVVDEYFTRIEQLPLVKTLRSGGLAAAGMTGSGRMGPRDTDAWTVPEEWLHDEFLGDIRPTVYRATAAGDVWRIITAEGRVQDSEYNEYHKAIRSIDTTGKSSEVSYNEDGLVTETIFPDGSSVCVEPGSWGVPVRVVGRDGLVSEYEVDACGLVTRVVDPTGAVTCCEFEYRASGVVPAVVVDAAGVRTVVECDDAGRTVAVVDAAGGRTSYVRDVRGLVSEVVDPVGAVTQVSYSPEGWVESVVQPDGGMRVFGYDGEGNITEAVSEIGAVTRTRFTVFDKPVEVVDPTGAVTRCTYNTQMQPVAVTNGDGHTWRFVYGLDGQVVSETDYNGVTTTTSTATDSDGVVTRVASAAGVKTVRVNRLGLVDSVSDAAGVIRYSYDELGRVRSVTTPETTVVFGVDEYGRRISETVTLASGESTVTQVEFDPIGRVVAEHTTTPTGQVISGFVTHDEVTGLIASTLVSRSTVDKVAAGVPGQVVTECGFGVDAASRRSWMHTGSLVREYAYDRCSRKTDDHTYLLDATAPGGRRRMSGYGLSWRVDDVVVGVADHLRGMKTFDVDVMGKITAVTTQPPAHTPTSHTPTGYTSTGHTPSLASSQASVGGVSEVYGFSAAGVLTSIRTDSQFQADGGYVPSSVSGVVSDVEFSGTKPVRVGRTRYEYDPAGRVIRTVTKRLSKKPLVKTFFMRVRRLSRWGLPRRIHLVWGISIFMMAWGVGWRRRPLILVVVRCLCG
ncbi:hypothetical protein CMUST_00815 [Corynebacterium mustelae]|uniref:DUF6531 domain-containing protein n=1 Tax=Corynebacterium mustelae TaxID=571915 RepID=A0A0G3GTR0_9CORY|nr:DUF6531 domain-containing protein [Corynebacterium mustelae]AKK04514.1 hypothetical protein CMUST_00815 [Corynebacterium mustelae]